METRRYVLSSTLTLKLDQKADNIVTGGRGGGRGGRGGRGGGRGGRGGREERGGRSGPGMFHDAISISQLILTTQQERFVGVEATPLQPRASRAARLPGPFGSFAAESCVSLGSRGTGATARYLAWR